MNDKLHCTSATTPVSKQKDIQKTTETVILPELRETAPEGRHQPTTRALVRHWSVDQRSIFRNKNSNAKLPDIQMSSLNKEQSSPGAGSSSESEANSFLDHDEFLDNIDFSAEISLRAKSGPSPTKPPTPLTGRSSPPSLPIINKQLIPEETSDSRASTSFAETSLWDSHTSMPASFLKAPEEGDYVEKRTRKISRMTADVNDKLHSIEVQEWNKLHSKIKTGLEIKHSSTNIGDLGQARLHGDKRLPPIKLPPRSKSEKGERNDDVLRVMKRIIHLRQKQTSRLKWKWAGRMIIHIVRTLSKLATRSYEMELKHKTFVDIGDHARVPMHTQGGDPDDKTKNKQVILTPEGRRILTTAAKLRDNDDVRRAMTDLQCLPNFCLYPLHTQYTMAKTGEFQEYSRRRVILKQGHVPTQFYFILAGQAVVSRMCPETNVRNLLGILGQGESFGEEAIMKKGPMEFSVISRKAMQLLCVPAESYSSLFPDETSEWDPLKLSPMTPSHVMYLSEQEWLQDWPIQALLVHPSQSFMQYSRHRQVIVLDSLKCKHLYVVRSGECCVVMKINHVQCSWHDFPKLRPPDGTTVDSYFAKMEAKKIAKKDPYRLVRPDDRSDTHLEKLYDFSVNSIKLPKRHAVLRTKKTSTGATLRRRSSGKLRGKQSQDVSSSGFKGSHEEVPCKQTLGGCTPYTSTVEGSSDEQTALCIPPEQEIDERKPSHSLTVEGSSDEQTALCIPPKQEIDERKPSHSLTVEGSSDEQMPDWLPPWKQFGGATQSTSVNVEERPIKLKPKRSIVRKTGSFMEKGGLSVSFHEDDFNHNNDVNKDNDFNKSNDVNKNNDVSENNDLNKNNDVNKTNDVNENNDVNKHGDVSENNGVKEKNNVKKNNDVNKNDDIKENSDVNKIKQLYPDEGRSQIKHKHGYSFVKTIKRTESDAHGKLAKQESRKTSSFRHITATGYQPPLRAQRRRLSSRSVQGLECQEPRVFTSGLARRKGYKIPDKCVPPAPATVHITPWTAKKDQYFVKVDTLSEGDVFVSCGAEVIGLDKQFFLQHADSKTQQRVLSRTMRHYPSAYQLQQKQKLNMAYNLYMEKIRDETLQDIGHTRKHYGLYFHSIEPLDPKLLLQPEKESV
ncbi:uncharacterized protein [Littorina saxatilis]|uniref:uncharacterized protein isoform X2 n=1 Tax=Littorina saxatilis TaxID=31220 RepID=UPI0038B5719C